MDAPEETPKEPEFVDVETFKKLEGYVSQVMEAIWLRIVEQVEKIEARMEEQDKQVAMLAMAFAESAVLIEALVGQLNFATEEEKKAFYETMKDSRKHMIEVMNSATNVETTGTEPGPTVEDVAE